MAHDRPPHPLGQQWSSSTSSQGFRKVPATGETIQNADDESLCSDDVRVQRGVSGPASQRSAQREVSRPGNGGQKKGEERQGADEEACKKSSLILI
ncbi:hypothetical protein ACOMHN_030691 [Nucella lapillus]